MGPFERQYAEIRDHLRFDDFPLTVKRVIDLTLDTGSLAHYRDTLSLLDWLDTHPDAEAVHQRLDERLHSLYQDLALKPLAEPARLVTVNGLVKTYAGGRFSLGPVHLDIAEGEIIGLVGENGNGKTTLLRSLCRELAPSSGRIEYHFPFTDEYDLRTQLVYIPQRTETWHGAVAENLQFTASLYGYAPEENELVVALVIARLGLRPFRNHSWKRLSSGYKMRFELARMLLRRPRILLIDEPLANLDILAQQTILDDFRAIAKSPFRPIGIVLSSQQLYEVEKTSDQVVFLKQGQQKNLFDKNSGGQPAQLMIELESDWSQAELHDAFGPRLASIQFNGGTYLLTFTEGTTIPDVLQTVLEAGIPLTYFRDISNSTRRFFAS